MLAGKFNLVWFRHQRRTHGKRWLRHQHDAGGGGPDAGASGGGGGGSAGTGEWFQHQLHALYWT